MQDCGDQLGKQDPEQDRPTRVDGKEPCQLLARAQGGDDRAEHTADADDQQDLAASVEAFQDRLVDAFQRSRSAGDMRKHIFRVQRRYRHARL